MIVTEFIGRNLDLTLIRHKKYSFSESKCIFCGRTINEGFSKKDVIQKTFTDYEYLKCNVAKNNYICSYCTICIGNVHYNEKIVALRNLSFVVWENKIDFLHRASTEKLLFNIPKNNRFILVYSFSQKKHVSFKAKFSHSSTVFKVCTDKGIIVFDTVKYRKLFLICKSWYTQIEKTKDNTFFTKKDILLGVENYTKIKKYGFLSYVHEDKYIAKYRNTLILEFLCDILQRTI